ncbi:serine/threonine protein kinase [Rubrivivax sp. JA1024]|nr:serine/threonine protein kinase [Rubrivivax sp. JA1024]
MSAGDHAASWAELEPLLDEALALPAAERDLFLQTLPPQHRHCRAALARLLAADAAAASAGFLDQAASLATGPGAAAPAEHAAGDEVGPWTLIAELGRGGMASVWRARPTQGELQREVALKLPHGPSPAWTGRLRRERDILARLAHPGIARLYDAGTTADGLPWLALEYVDGQDLLAWCESRHSPLAERLGLLLQICDALQYAHGRLVIHRDIKPANVLVQADGQVRLLDFGIARLLDAGSEPGLTQHGQRPMTPEYASPEQVRGEEPGVATDVYALGVLAYRLVTGCSPYAAWQPGHRHALEHAVLECEPPAPSAVVADPALARALRGDLDTWIAKALRKPVAERYAGIDAMAADLRRHLAGEPLLARPQPWRERARRFVGRHRWAVGTGALAVCGLIGTTAWALQSAQQARAEARRAEAMYGFVVDLFNPEHKPLPDTREREMPLRLVIERGAQQVLRSLQSQPEARDRLLADLGTLTQQLGLAPLSQQLADERVRQAEQVQGRGSVAWADALIGQRDLREASGRYADGLAEAQQALAAYEAHGVKDPLRLARALMARGGFGARLHPPSDADLADLERAAALLKPLPGRNPLGTVYEQLMVAHVNRGDFDAAFRAAQDGIEANRRQWGADDWKTAAAEDQAGQLAAWALEPERAEEWLRHAIAVTRRVMGEDVVILSRSHANLALLLLADGRRDEARREMAEAERIAMLPVNAALLPFRLTAQANSMEFELRDGNWSALAGRCAGLGEKPAAPQPALELRFLQMCIASAVHERRLGRAQDLLEQARALLRGPLAGAAARGAVIVLREGDVAAAAGRTAEARDAWQRSIALARPTGVAWVVEAGQRLADSGGLDPASRNALQDWEARLRRQGGQRHYAALIASLQQSLAR